MARSGRLRKTNCPRLKIPLVIQLMYQTRNRNTSLHLQPSGNGKERKGMSERKGVEMEGMKGMGTGNRNGRKLEGEGQDGRDWRCVSC